MSQNLKEREIPGVIRVEANADGLARIKITSRFSAAEVCPHGAHIMQFQRNGERPLIFLSRKSLFKPDKAIRGGVPICFPWFGSREGNVAHGMVRIKEWDLTETISMPDGSVRLNFVLPETILPGAGWPAAKVSFSVWVAEKLTMELTVLNTSSQDFAYEECLHSYFAVGDISQVAISGLQGFYYLDKVEDFAHKLESSERIKIHSEVDRVYLKTTGTVEIRDESWGRVITVTKMGSASTVVWNPWTEKAKAMNDFGEEEYRQMVCVESGNVGESKIVLAPGKSATLSVELQSRPI